MSTMGDPSIPPPPGMGASAGNGQPLLQRKVGGIPVPVLLGAGAVGIWFLWQRHKNNTSAAATSSNLAGTTTVGTTPYGPYPIDPSTYASPTGFSGNPWWSNGTGGPGTDPNSAGPPPPISAPAVSTPTPVASTGAAQVGPPPNQYQVGQQVAPGESIVNSAYDSVTGTWLNLTNRGGVYTSGGAGIGNMPYGGSYLGYLNSLKNTNPKQYNAELPTALAGDGLFSNGALAVNPDGSYTLVNNLGQKYGF